MRDVIPKPKMIVFDKDGTLGDCTPALSAWSSRMTNAVMQKCASAGIPPSQVNDVVLNFHQAIGWDDTAQDVVPSAVLSAATWDEIVDASAVSLAHSGLDVDRNEVLQWHKNLGDIHADDPTLVKNLPRFLRHFRHHGIMIAICTSDDRACTEACMRNWGISDLVDFSLCGDEVEESKPSPKPLYELAKRANVHPSECVVVGDTSSDSGMGRSGGAGLVVGVLTGSGTEAQLLATGADVVVPNVGYLTDLLLLKSGSPSTEDNMLVSRASVVSLEEETIPAYPSKKMKS